MMVLTALRSLIFMVAFYIGTVLVLVAATIGGIFSTRAIPAMARVWSLYHRLTTRWLLGQKIRIEGDLPAGNYLYIFKHESMFETIDLLCLFDHPAIAAKRELLDIPFWGWLARRYGLIPIERTAGAKALRALRSAALAALADGRPLCLFPEGTRVPHGEEPPMRAGFAGLYGLLKLPVVPVAIDSGRLSPRRSFLKLPGTITYRVGAVVPPGLDRAEAEAAVHAAINALNRVPARP